jgi:hypothetical protein
MLTEKERHILDHALRGGTSKEYRNHYVTGPGSDDYDACMALVERGLMQRHGRSWIPDPIFIVTDAGRRALGGGGS